MGRSGTISASDKILGVKRKHAGISTRPRFLLLEAGIIIHNHILQYKRNRCMNFKSFQMLNLSYTGQKEKGKKKSLLTHYSLIVSKIYPYSSKLLITTLVSQGVCQITPLSHLSFHQGEAGTGSVADTCEAASSFDMAT